MQITPKNLDYYSEIMRHCISNDSSKFHSKWFYESYPVADRNTLHNFRSQGLIKTETPASRTFEIINYYSYVRYAGLCCAAYIKNNPRKVNAELQDCVRQTWLEPNLNEFLILTYDLSSAKKAVMLDMDLEELEILEDYFYMRLASNVVKAGIELPVGSVVTKDSAFSDD